MLDVVQAYTDSGLEKSEGATLFLSDYQPLLESFDYDIVLERSEDDEDAGVTRVLFREREKYGYLYFEWGLHPQIDKLQQCTSWEQVRELQEEMHHAIVWRANSSLMLQFIYTHNWQAERTDSFEFRDRAIGLLVKNRFDWAS